MIRILLSLAVAAAAYYGPWFAEAAAGGTEIVRAGDHYAGATVACASEGRFSLSGECAPAQGVGGTLVTMTVILGLASAVLGVLGLLPFVGRATSLAAVVAGASAIGAAGLVALGVMDTPSAGLESLRWGAFATGGFGVLLTIAGVSGLRGG